MPRGYAKYAEHPYWRGTYNGFDVDIVPCYKINSPEERISAVDRTPFHTEYIKSHLKDWQRDEIRLLKAYLKGIGIYGAEAKIRGFSGYLSELLVLKYGDFKSVLKNVSSWRKRVYLYLEKPSIKFKDPVVFIDPVDPKRNAASAVSEESKSIFIYAAKSYLNHPKIEFFFPKNIAPLSHNKLMEKINERGTIFYVFKFPKPDIIDDNLYPQINRTMESLTKILADFEVITHFYIVDEHNVYFIIELARDTLPRIKIHQGPPVWHQNSKNFVEKWRNKAIRGPYIKGYRFYVEVERDVRKIDDVVRKNIEKYKLGIEFDKIKDKMVMGKIDSFLKEIDAQSLTQFFNFTFPWER
jgi:tRNA nucleotidyltransferase (CCA-adding enzyme)